MTPKAKKLSKLRVAVVSLVDRGANQIPVVLKAFQGDDNLRVWKSASRAADSGRTLYGIVAVPDTLDAHGEWQDRETIQKAAHEFLRDGGKYDINHDMNLLSRDAVHVAESLIIQKGDPRFSGWKDDLGRPVNEDGAWGIVLKINDQGLQTKINDGKINGLSLYGFAIKTEEPVPVQKTQHQQDRDMTPEELKALTEAMTAAVAKGLEPVIKALTPAAAPAATPAPAPVAKAFDPLTASDEEILRHQHAIEVAELAKQFNLGNLEEIKEYRLAKKSLDETLAQEIQKTREERRFRLRPGGSQPAGDIFNGASLPAPSAGFTAQPPAQGQVVLAGTDLALPGDIGAVVASIEKRYAPAKKS